MTAINLGYYSNSPYGLFPYADPLALDKLGIEVLMRGLITRSLGIEATRTRYNYDLIRILWKIASDGITANNYSASSNASVDKSMVNLKSDIIEQYWQSTSNTAQWFQFDIGVNLVSYIDTFALIGTNLTSSAVIRIYGYGTGINAAPATWTEAMFIKQVDFPVNPLEKDRIYIATSLPTIGYRHFRVTISDPSNTDAFIRIGRCLAGSALIFNTENCADTISYKKENYKDEFQISGFSSISNNRSLKKMLTINFTDINTIQYTNYSRLIEYIEYSRDSLKSLVIVDPRLPYQFSIFAKLKSMPEEVHEYISLDTSIATMSLSYDEAK